MLSCSLGLGGGICNWDLFVLGIGIGVCDTVTCRKYCSNDRYNEVTIGH